jgi:hypothetical protein
MAQSVRVLAVLAAVTLTVGTVAFGTTAELRRTVAITDTVNEDVQNHRVAMSAALKQVGCEEMSLLGFIAPNKPSELVLVMTCKKWGTGVSYTPAKK